MELFDKLYDYEIDFVAGDGIYDIRSTLEAASNITNNDLKTFFIPDIESKRFISFIEKLYTDAIYRAVYFPASKVD